jgi:hypothetical protein
MKVSVVYWIDGGSRGWKVQRLGDRMDNKNMKRVYIVKTEKGPTLLVCVIVFVSRKTED